MRRMVQRSLIPRLKGRMMMQQGVTSDSAKTHLAERVSELREERDMLLADRDLYRAIAYALYDSYAEGRELTPEKLAEVKTQLGR